MSGTEAAWTYARDETLRALWAEGLTTTEIARRMGKTKNAVVGRAHRMNLSGRPSPIGTTRVTWETIDEWILDHAPHLVGRPRQGVLAQVNSIRVASGCKPYAIYSPVPTEADRQEAATSVLAGLVSAAPARPPAVSMAPQPSRMAVAPAAVAPAPLLLGRPRRCAYPMWGDHERPGPSPRFCDAPTKPDADGVYRSSWCDEHHHRCYTARRALSDEQRAVLMARFAAGRRQRATVAA